VECNADCIAALCGNGVINSAVGEQCDTGGESANCNANCTVPRCGDGQLNSLAGDVCDAGAQGGAPCTNDCDLQRCGDGVVDLALGEACDDAGGSTVCNEDCTVSRCGDAILNSAAGEQCDSGGVQATLCNLDCTLVTCGDGIVNLDSGEECDPPRSGICDPSCRHELTALLVVGPTPAIDSVINARLVGLGFAVDQVTDNDLKASDGDGYRLVIASPSADGMPVGTKLRDVTRPAMAMEEETFAGSGFGQPRYIVGASGVEFAAEHPMTAGLAGPLPLVRSGEQVGGIFPVDSTLTIARGQKNPGLSLLFAYEAGSQMSSGTALARRVGFPFAVHDFNTNSPAWTLFDAAVSWLIAVPVPIYDSCAELLVKHPSLPSGLYVVSEGAAHKAMHCSR
jgi:hypothetical protein